jgi:hypothetical protein
MAKINANNVNKYLQGLKKMKKKYVTSDMLSSSIGIYPDVINETLSFFDPMVNMDYQYNLMDLVPQLETYLEEHHVSQAKTKAKAKEVSKKPMEKLPYDSVNDFVYERMSFGGFLNRDTYLSDSDLKMLKKLVSQEQEKRKALKKKKK